MIPVILNDVLKKCNLNKDKTFLKKCVNVLKRVVHFLIEENEKPNSLTSSSIVEHISSCQCQLPLSLCRMKTEHFSAGQAQRGSDT